MTTFRVRCSSCEKILKAPESARGKTVKCSCGHAFRIPEKKAAASRQLAAAARPRREPESDEVVEEFDEYEEPVDDDEYEDDEFDARALPPRRSKSGGRRPQRRAGQGKSSLWDLFSGKNAILQALDEHEAETGERYELIKAGMPPIRLWLRNRKGDRWGLVEDDSGTEFWIRYRRRLLSRGPVLTFFD